MPRRYVLSEFAMVSWRDGQLQITSPASGVTSTHGDSSLLGVLAAFAVPRASEDVVREVSSARDVAALIREWIAAAILVDADLPELAAVHHWNRESLASHFSSRNPEWRTSPTGATAAAVAPRRSKQTIPLSPGPTSGGGDLAALLAVRRSRRIWANEGIGFQKFCDLFWMSARNRPTMRHEHVSRPYPSGGAAYSLELYPVLAEGAVDTLEPGLYRYLPEAHALEPVSPFDGNVQQILAAAGQAAATTPPPMAIVITSRYARQSERYGPLAYTLVLKEVGGLFQTLYLAAESLGLAACALGRGTPAGLFAHLCRTTEIEEPVVGELAIGMAAEGAIEGR